MTTKELLLQRMIDNLTEQRKILISFHEITVELSSKRFYLDKVSKLDFELDSYNYQLLKVKNEVSSNL